MRNISLVRARVSREEIMEAKSLREDSDTRGEAYTHTHSKKHIPESVIFLGDKVIEFLFRITPGGHALSPTNTHVSNR